MLFHLSKEVVGKHFVVILRGLAGCLCFLLCLADGSLYCLLFDIHVLNVILPLFLLFQNQIKVLVHLAA